MTRTPFDQTNWLRGQLRSLLDEAFPIPQTVTPPVEAWVPAADILADGNRVVLSLEACGLSRDDLEVTLKGAVLTIRGRRERDPKEGAAEEQLLFVERSAGEFSRAFALSFEPRSYDSVLKDGVLTVTLEA